MTKQRRELMPPFIFDKIWRSKYATEKFVKKILLEEFDFKNKNVLDFGCGTGSYCIFFDSDKYLGIDTDRKRIEYTKKEYPRYRFHVFDKSKNLLNLKKTFDVVFVVSVLHHLPDKDCSKYIKMFYEVLNPKGKVIMMEPCLFPKSRFNNWFMEFIDRGKYIRTEEEYKNLFRGYFNVIVHKKYKRHSVYNEIFFSATKPL